jgi:hypothetical protein
MDILARIETLCAEHPGAIIHLRCWWSREANEMHYILSWTDQMESWTATGSSLGEAYCELRRQMVIGNSN